MINNDHISAGCLYICGIFTWNPAGTKKPFDWKRHVLEVLKEAVCCEV